MPVRGSRVERKIVQENEMPIRKPPTKDVAAYEFSFIYDLI